MKRTQTEPKFKDGWGDTIRELREYRGYSQKDLAGLLNVSKATVSKWEREVMVPSLDISIDLASILMVDIETLFEI